MKSKNTALSWSILFFCAKLYVYGFVSFILNVMWPLCGTDIGFYKHSQQEGIQDIITNAAAQKTRTLRYDDVFRKRFRKRQVGFELFSSSFHLITLRDFVLWTDNFALQVDRSNFEAGRH